MTEAHPAEGAAATAPTCYRHPERETYIRCARCDKPICPECMVSAAVGFQCPDCVAEGRRSQRPVRTVFGGEVHRRTNVVTLTLVGVCVVTFGLQLAIPAFTGDFALVGLDVAAGQWYRLLTCGFLHVSVLHILFNMWALWVVGPPLEGVFGRVRFTAVYFVSLLCGSAASYLFGDPRVPALGASGAIFGLFGALFVVARRMRWNAGGIVALIVVNLLLPFFMPSIDWHAHVGGLVGGAAAAAVMAYAPQRWRKAASLGVSVVLVLACVVLVQLRTTQLKESPRFGPQIEQIQEQGADEGDFRPSIQ
jgi:membrane associated rhomboid family serine protease